MLYAFRDELLRLYKTDHYTVSARLLSYLIGKYDFYKIIKENGTVSIQSFNIFASLGWGSKIPLPQRIIEAELKANSHTTIVVIFDNGWQISFRIHNASSKVEPSLKFDIQIVGWPSLISRHVINYLHA